jgi:hypothetical protein
MSKWQFQNRQSQKNFNRETKTSISKTEDDEAFTMSKKTPVVIKTQN